jgi:hypothetical protein
MITKSGFSSNIKLTPGEPAVLDFNFPYRFTIKTIAGTIIEGTGFPNAPFTVIPTTDIAEFTIFMEKEHVAPIHLVEDHKDTE